MCWNCKEKFLIEPEYSRGICPICKKENIIEKKNELVDFWYDFITVVCNECGKKLILKKESNYCVCTKCKSTILIQKDVVGNVPIEYSNLTAKEYFILLSKEKSFNPYLFPKGSKYNLEPDFEKKLKETKIGIFDNENEQDFNDEDNNEINDDTEYFLDNNGDEHLFQTIKENANKISTKYNLK